jgi:hypothetical protein
MNANLQVIRRILVAGLMAGALAAMQAMPAFAGRGFP